MGLSDADWRALLAPAVGNSRFVVLDSAFDAADASGQGRCAVLRAAWRATAAPGCVLHVLGRAKGGWDAAAVARVLASPSPASVSSPAADPAPPPLRGLHRLRVNGVQWLLSAEGDAALWWRDLVAAVDAFVLHERDFCSQAGLLSPRRVRALSRLAAPGAVARVALAPTPAAGTGDGTTSDGVEAMSRALAAAGWRVRDAGVGNVDDAIAVHALWAHYVTPAQRGRAGGLSPSAPEASAQHRAHASSNRHQTCEEKRLTALVVGAGIAGCAAAWALAEQGWHATVVDRHAGPATEASGNPAGLYHGVFHRNDGPHARFNRAAALELQRVARRAIREHGVKGATEGLMRLERGADVAAMRADLEAAGMPATYLQALDADAAGRHAGWPLGHPAWLYAGGGWIDPAGLARAYLAWAGTHCRFVGGCAVASLEAIASRNGGPPRWRALDEAGAVLAEVDAVVLANAGDALRLCPAPWLALAPEAALLSRSRGQLSALPLGTPGLATVRLPLSGSGYVLPPIDGRVLFGATTQLGDSDPRVRDADHDLNLSQLTALTGSQPLADAHACSGRTAFRWFADDRLPLIGAVPQAAAADGSVVAPVPAGAGAPRRPRLDQPRLVPRTAGLFLYTGMGSRGITWSALGAQVLASWVTGAPQPVEAALVDAVDPARWVARAARRLA